MSQSFHLNTTGTFVLQSAGGGKLHSVTVGTAGTASTITLHDSPDNTGPVVAEVSGAQVSSLEYDVELSNGLTAVIAGTSAPDVTITID